MITGHNGAGKSSIFRCLGGRLGSGSDGLSSGLAARRRAFASSSMRFLMGFCATRASFNGTRRPDAKLLLPGKQRRGDEDPPAVEDLPQEFEFIGLFGLNDLF